MATRNRVETDREATPRVAIEKLDNGEYRLEVRVQTDLAEESIAISHAEIMGIGTAPERAAVLAWLVKAYDAAKVKAGFE